MDIDLERYLDIEKSKFVGYTFSGFKIVWTPLDVFVKICEPIFGQAETQEVVDFIDEKWKMTWFKNLKTDILYVLDKSL